MSYIIWQVTNHLNIVRHTLRQNNNMYDYHWFHFLCFHNTFVFVLVILQTPHRVYTWLHSPSFLTLLLSSNAFVNANQVSHLLLPLVAAITMSKNHDKDEDIERKEEKMNEKQKENDSRSANTKSTSTSLLKPTLTKTIKSKPPSRARKNFLSMFLIISWYIIYW